MEKRDTDDFSSAFLNVIRPTDFLPPRILGRTITCRSAAEFRVMSWTKRVAVSESVSSRKKFGEAGVGFGDYLFV